jgi:xylulose-5-phosphate/fructose-6-phosphate phosphoketolase
MHRQMAATLDTVIDEIARDPARGAHERCDLAPALADDRAQDPQGLDRAEGGRRQENRGFLALAPGAVRRSRGNPEHLQLLEQWLKSYRPEELFDAHGAPVPDISALARGRSRRMGANPHANGGLLLKDLRLPDFRDYAVACRARRGRGRGHARHGRVPARRDEAQRERRNFRVFGPDETASNRLGALFEVTDRAWMAEPCRRTKAWRRTGG